MTDKEKFYEELKKPFENDAIQKVKMGKRQYDSIKAQYVVERLNEVLGISGWSLKGEFKATEKGILFFGTLEVKALSHEVQTVGFAPFRFDLGDAYKSAKTAALSKAASWIGVGNEVFKGKGNVPYYGDPVENKSQNNNEQPMNTESSHTTTAKDFF
jgi:hypothetical protein